MKNRRTEKITFAIASYNVETRLQWTASLSALVDYQRAEETSHITINQIGEIMTIKHQSEYDEAMQQAEKDFHAADSKEMVEKCPFIFSSNMADAYWISAWSLYHNGFLPRALYRRNESQS